jgi:hypothetical protein
MIFYSAVTMPAQRPFRLTAPIIPEIQIHTACVDALDQLLMRPAEWCCYPAGAAQLSPQQQARYSRLGLKRGYPDLMVFYQKVYGIEIKRQGGKLSKTKLAHTRRGGPRLLIGQEEMFPTLMETGAWGGIAVVHSVTEMLDQLADWGIPLRGHW